MRPHTDYVHDMVLHTRDDLLATVSADGRLSKIDPRQRKVLQVSEGDPDDELLCVAVVKGGNKVVAGSTTGVVDVFTWKDICDCSDRWPGAGCCMFVKPYLWCNDTRIHGAMIHIVILCVS